MNRYIDKIRLLDLVILLLSLTAFIISFKPYCYMTFTGTKTLLYLGDAVDVPSAKILYAVPITIIIPSLLSLLNIKNFSWRSSYYVMSSFLGVVTGSLAVGDLQGSATFIVNELGSIVEIKCTNFFVFFVLVYVMIAFVGLLQYRLEVKERTYEKII